MAKLDKDPREPKNPARLARAEAVRAATGEEWQARTGGKLEKAGGDGLKLVVAKAPEYIVDADGEIVGVDAWVQLFDERGRELKIDPHRRIINPPTVPRSGVRMVDRAEQGRTFKARVVTPDPAAAFWEAVWDSVTETPNPKGWRTRGTVTTVYSGTADGALLAGHATYATAREGGLGTAFSTFPSDADVRAGQIFTGSQYECREMFIAFDISAIPDLDAKTDIQLSLWLVTDGTVTADFTVEARHRIWTPTLANDDFVAGSLHTGFTEIANMNAAGTVGAYNTMTTLPAFFTPSFLTADTLPIMLASSRHRAGIAPTGEETVRYSTGDASGTTQDPRLTVTHGRLAPPSFTSRPNRIWRLG